jgi:hypothetical protein
MLELNFYLLKNVKNMIDPVNSQNIKTLKSVIDDRALVLDYGAGREQYRSLVQDLGATYLRYEPNRTIITDDRDLFKNSKNPHKVILALDVVQHVENTYDFFLELEKLMSENTILILTYPFLFPVCDNHDYHRWTAEGITNLLSKHSLTVRKRTFRGGLFTCIIESTRMFIINLKYLNPKTWFLRRKSILWWIRLIVDVVFIIPRRIAFFIDLFLPQNGVYLGEVLEVKKNK